MVEKISVAVCTYNGERFLREQIDSILAQTRAVDEIVVCDDGSSDDTLDILDQYAKTNPGIFRIYQNEVNLRSVKNFEKAINLCTGDVIFLADQDDRWREDKVGAYLSFFEQHPRIQVLCSNGYCINDASEVLEKHTVWDGPKFLKEKNIAFDYYSLIAYISNIATGASMAIKKEIIPDIMPFPSIKHFHHDEWIAIIASRKGAFDMLHEKYFYYRIHDSQQVGGVSFVKTDAMKRNITNVFDYDNPDFGFTLLKRRLRNFADSHKKNKKLYNENERYRAYFKENLEVIEKKFEQTRKMMWKRHFLKTLGLRISDYIFNKRQLK